MSLSPSPSRRLHVVSLQVPFPPDYGGVIDIYYKLKALKNMGYETWLHTFQYDRSRAEQLNEVAARVSYYPRHRSVIRQLSHIPYIVSIVQNFSTICFPTMPPYCSKVCIAAPFYPTNG